MDIRFKDDYVRKREKGIRGFTVLLKMSFFFKEITVSPEKDRDYFYASSSQQIEVKINNNGKKTHELK